MDCGHRDAVLLVFADKQVRRWLSEYWDGDLLPDAHLKNNRHLN